MSILTLDLSRNSGWAQFQEGWQKPAYGTLKLGSAKTSSIGRSNATLFKGLLDIHRVTEVKRVFVEKPYTPFKFDERTNWKTLRMQFGYVTVVQMFAHHINIGMPVEVDPNTWRLTFLQDFKRTMKRPTLKKLAIERCQQFGWSPKNDDEADALGLLDSVLLDRKIQTPWRTAETLQPTSEVR